MEQLRALKCQNELVKMRQRRHLGMKIKGLESTQTEDAQMTDRSEALTDPDFPRDQLTKEEVNISL